MTNLGKESETVEFKEGIAQLDKGIKALSAMLNRHNNGKVFFSVNDTGEVIGMDVGDSTLEKIRNAVRSDIQPHILPDISILTSDDGKAYICIEVTGHDVPYSWKDRYFIRNHTSNESAGPEIISQIVLSKGSDPLRDCTSDLQDLKFEHLFTILTANGHHPRLDSKYFRSIGFLDDRGNFNMNAYLLSDQNTIPMQIVEFKGTDKTEISRRMNFGNCSLLKSMDQITDYIFGLMDINVDTDTLERTETPLFDMGAFREAWVNACVHNAWRSYIPPSVFLFDNRIEIVSYGRIPFPLSDDDFYSGDSRPLNPTLFSMFARLNRIEQSGHGVPRIVKSYGRGAFHITESGVRVTIPFAFTPRFVLHRKSEELIKESLPADQSKVLRYLYSNETAKLSEVSDSTDISLSSVKKIVTALKTKGLLKNEGTNRNSRWIVP